MQGLAGCQMIPTVCRSLQAPLGTLSTYLVDPRRAVHRYFVFFLACCFIPGPYLHDTLLSAYKLQICSPSGLGIGSTAFALLFGLPSAMGALSGPMASVTAMWGDARTSLVSASLTFVASAGVVVSLHRGSYALLLAFRLFFWLGLYLLLAVQMVIVYKLFKGPDLTMAMGFIIMSCRVGGMAAFLSSGLLLKFARGDVVTALWCSVALVGGAMLAAVLYAFLRGGTAAARTLLPIIEARADNASAQSAGLLEEVRGFSRSTWVLIAEVAILYSVVFPFEAVETGFLETDWGLSVDYVGWYTSMGTFFGLFSWAWGFCVTSSRGLLRCSCLAWCLMAGAFVAFRWRDATNPGLAFVAVCCFGLAYSFLSTACWILVPGTFGPERDCSAGAVSAAYIAMSLGMLASNFCAGVLHDHIGYGAVCAWFLALSAAGLCCAAALSCVFPRARSPELDDARAGSPQTVEVEVAVRDPMGGAPAAGGSPAALDRMAASGPANAAVSDEDYFAGR